MSNSHAYRLYAYYIGDEFQFVGTMDEFVSKYNFTPDEIKKMRRIRTGSGKEYDSLPILILLEKEDDEGNLVL